MASAVIQTFDEADGWFLGHVGRVQLFYMDQRVTDPSFDRYVAALAREIDSRSEARDHCVYYHLLAPQIMTSTRRKMVADVLSPRQDKLKRTTAAYAATTPSMIGRGVMTAIFWLASSPYPHKVVNTTQEGMSFLAEHNKSLDVNALVKAHAQALGRFQIGHVGKDTSQQSRV